MSLHPSVLVFLAVWVAGAMIALRQAVPRVSRGDPAGVVGIPLAMLGFMYVLVSASFWWEAGVARRRLEEILSSGESGRMDASGVN
jgi:HAMP domain-containing protein